MNLEELKLLKQWFCWKYIKNKDGKPTKVPKSYKNEETGVDEGHRETWCTYDEAKSAVKKYSFDGIGFIFYNGICGIDIDKRDLEDPISKDILSLFSNTYAEKSPSGKGFHTLFLVDPSKIPKDYKEKYYQKNVKLDIECYIGGVTKRYFTYTGDVINDKPITDCTEELLTFLDKYMLRETKSTSTTHTDTEIKSIKYIDSEITDDICDYIIEAIKKSKQAEKFNKLYFDGDISDYSEDDSSADMALCGILAFYCGNYIKLIDKLFCGSKLYRKKWDRPDYKYNTIKKAIDGCKGKFYIDGINYRLLSKFKEIKPEKKYKQNDRDTSKLFSDIYQTCLRFNATANKWYFYNGTTWTLDTGSMNALQKAKEFSKVFSIYASSIEFEEESYRTKYISYVAKLGELRTRQTLLNDSKDNFPLYHTDLDKKEDLFNCQNGTLNLKTFEFTEHKYNDFLSKVSNVVYDTEATCPQFLEFINKSLEHNTAKIDFLQKALGYSLTTDTSKETCFILYGKTARNGKRYINGNNSLYVWRLCYVFYS